MRYTKLRPLVLLLISGIGTMLIMVGLLRATPTLAHALEMSESRSLVQPPPPSDDDWVVQVYFTDPATIPIYDLIEVDKKVGEGIHLGEVRCNRNNCNQKVNLQFTIPLTDWSFEYKFTTRQMVDPVEQRAVVAGTGTIFRGSQKERFLFTATIQNLMDGTIAVRYEASRPDASFIIKKAPGTFIITRRR